MGIITVGQESSTPVEFHYEDHGSVPPVVMLAGWPLDSRSWEDRLLSLLGEPEHLATTLKGPELPTGLRAWMQERAEATRPR